MIRMNRSLCSESIRKEAHLPGDIEVAAFKEEGCPIFTTCSSRESCVVCISTCTSGKVMRLAFKVKLPLICTCS